MESIVKESISDALARMIDVNSPIIYIQDYDFWRIDNIIRNAVQSAAIVEWNPVTQATDFDTKNGFGVQLPLNDFLMELYEDEFTSTDKYVVLKDVHELLNDDGVQATLHLMAQRRLYDATYNTTVFIVDSILNVPQTIQEYVSIFDVDGLKFPNETEIKEIINEHTRINKYHEIDDQDRTVLMPTLKGLSRFQIDRMLDVAMSSNGSLSSEDSDMILRQKKAIVKKSGIVELVDTPEKLDSIGGLDVLKDYLKKKSKVMKNFGDAQAHGVEVPKGVFIVGMPGCGKSLCAKASAALFNVPLIKLDMGSMMGKYVGDSEANLRLAIRTAEAAAPCVLWIDEIEKAFSGVGKGENDVLMRMFGYFLSWMQDKTSAVYVVATANNADNLPPELKRKGRFDEIFCVNLPNKEEIKKIFEIHLNKGVRKKCLKDEKLMDISKISDSFFSKFEDGGFNGADIEAIIKEAIENVYIDDKKEKLTLKDIEDVRDHTNSISVTSKEQIENMKKIFKENKFTDASNKS